MSREEAHDPTVDAFLDFLGRDMDAHPERATGIPADLLAAFALVAAIPVDLDAPIEGDVAI